MNKLIGIVFALCILGHLVVGEASASPSDNIQITSYFSKDIGYIIRNRQITTIEYNIQLDGYYLQCVSVMFTRVDGSVLSHAHSECIAHIGE